MGIRKLRLNDDEILRKKARPVENVDDRIREILCDMADTMYAAGNGVGLAANQVGLLKRLVTIDMGDHLYKMVNPEIVSEEGEQLCLEGCLSFPGKWGNVRRPWKVTVRALDENGQSFELTGEGDLAKCLCHEIDHLDGIVFVDKVTEFVQVEE